MGAGAKMGVGCSRGIKCHECQVGPSLSTPPPLNTHTAKVCAVHSRTHMGFRVCAQGGRWLLLQKPREHARRERRAGVDVLRASHAPNTPPAFWEGRFWAKPKFGDRLWSVFCRFA